MNVRRASRDDSRGVAPLLAQLGYPVAEERLARRFARLADNVADAAWVAVEPGDDGCRVIGFAAGHLSQPYELDAPVAELTALIVDDTFRAMGAGRALVGAFEEWSVSAGVVRASAATAFHREAAHAFYEHLGYQQLAKKYEKSF